MGRGRTGKDQDGEGVCWGWEMTRVERRCVGDGKGQLSAIAALNNTLSLPATSWCLNLAPVKRTGTGQSRPIDQGKPRALEAYLDEVPMIFHTGYCFITPTNGLIKSSLFRIGL